MFVWLLLILTTFPGAPQDAFALRCDIQAWYDELAQTVLQSRTPGDIDIVHSVFETDDVSFADADGHRHSPGREPDRGPRPSNGTPPPAAPLPEHEVADTGDPCHHLHRGRHLGETQDTQRELGCGQQPESDPHPPS